MTIENTEPQGTLVEGPEWLTQDTLDKLVKDPTHLETLKPEQKKEFHSFMEQNVGGKPAPVSPTPAAPAAVTPPAAGAPAVPDPAAPTGDIKGPEDIPAKRPQDKDKFWKERERLLTDNNRNKQLLEKANKDREALEAKLAELQKKPVTAADANDPLDLNSIRNLQERLEKSEQMVSALTTHVQSTTGMLQSEYETRNSTLEQDATAVALERFQLETADGERIPEALSLKTTVPFAELKSEIEEFATTMGGLDKVNAYLSDPAYKARCEAAGFKLSEGFIKNLPAYNEIWAINKAVLEGKAPDHMTAYLSRLVQNGKLREWQQAAKLEGANAVANNISNRTNQTPLLSPNEGPKPAASGWTKESAMQWYAEHPDIKPNSPEALIKAQISELIRSGQLR